MEFLKKVGSTAESLLDQVDQKTAEISKDVRSGNYAARLVAERLEKRERVKVEAGGVVDSDLAKQIERLQADLDAAGEVLQRSQQLAAERELKLTSQLEKDRTEREEREEELLQRIRILESHEQKTKELEDEVLRLEQQLEEAQGPKDEEAVDLEVQLEDARQTAEQARTALANAMRESENRIAILEQTNLALVQELTNLKKGQDSLLSFDGASGQPNPRWEEERNRLVKELQDTEDRLTAAEDRRASLELQLNAERARAERLEADIVQAGANLLNVQEAHAKKIVALETKIALLKGEADEARADSERLKRISQDNGRDALEKRLESLSHHLELKQRQLDSIRSEKLALEQRLNDSTTIPTLRARILPSGSNIHTGGELKGRFVRLKIDPGKHKTVARALDVLDGLTLSAAAIMRSQPIARIGFIVYVFILHLWVFSVLNWTTVASNRGSHSEAQLAAVNGGTSLRGATLVVD